MHNSHFRPSKHLASVQRTPLTMLRSSGGQLHVAFVSSDLTDHIVGHGIASLLKMWRKLQHQQHHQHTMPRVTIVPLTADDGSAAGAACRTLAHAIIDGSRCRVLAPSSSAPSLNSRRSGSAQDVAQAINAASVHVVLDLNGHTKGYCCAAAFY
jgi:predicted O-linked N-acetylglucosamine transferase (SPINDLY family)